MRLEASLMRPVLPNGRGPEDVKKAREPRGRWEKPKRDDSEDADNDRRGVSVMVGGTGLILKFGMIPAEGRFHDTFMTPYAPWLMPLLFGVAVSQMDAIETCKEGEVQHGPFALMSLLMMWETGKLFWEAASRHTPDQLIPAAVCAGGIIIGRGLKGSSTKKKA